MPSKYASNRFLKLDIQLCTPPWIGEFNEFDVTAYTAIAQQTNSKNYTRN